MRKNQISKILIVTERFFPEEFLINDLASEWQAKGYEVEVLTQVPSYPFDKVYDGYENKLLQSEVWNGIKIHRVKTILGYKRSIVRKVINYLVFAFLTSCWSLFKGWKYERVFVYHTGPLTMASSVILLRLVWWRRVMIWTQDLWPDTVYAYGFKPVWWKRLMLNFFVISIYRCCSKVAVSCEGFSDKLSAYTSKDVQFFPQWYAGEKEVIAKTENNTFTFTFAGNIGSVQNLETVVQVFGELALENAELLIVGDGVNLPLLEEIKTTNEFQNITFTGRLPFEKMPEVFARSDVMIICLKDDPIFELTVPAKFQAYIASGKPIMGILKGEVADMIQKYSLGLTAEPNDHTGIKRTFKHFFDMKIERLRECGDNSSNLSLEKFNKSLIVDSMTRQLTD